MIACVKFNYSDEREQAFVVIFRDLAGGASQECPLALSALEEAGDESARCAGYSAIKPCICTESWVVPREFALVPSRTGAFLFLFL